MANFQAPDLEVQVTSQNETQTPAQFYAAWAAALGLPPTGTDVTLAATDDGVTIISTRPPTLSVFYPMIQVGAEGNLAFWQYGFPGATALSFLYPTVSRMYVAAPNTNGYPRDSRPGVWAVLRPAEIDCACRNFTYRADALGNAIYFFTLTTTGSSTPLMNVAVRIYGYQKVLIVAMPVTGASAPTFKAFNGVDVVLGYQEALVVNQSRSILIENTGFASQSAIPVPTFKTSLPHVRRDVTNKLPPASFGQTVVHRRVSWESTNMMPPVNFYGIVKYPDIRSRSRRNWLNPGYGYIAGDIKKDAKPLNLPTFSKIRLLRERDGMQVREIWSNPTDGTYRFNDLEEDHTYTVLAYDTNNNFRAVLANRVVPIHTVPLVP